MISFFGLIMGNLKCITVSDREQSPVIFCMGIILLVLRLGSYMSFQTDYYFEPELSHISYLVSFIAAFAMICSFRQPVLNAIPFVLLPSFFITIPFWDVPVLLTASELPVWHIINALTIHIPACLIGIWILINRKELVSLRAIAVGFAFGFTYFLFVDNKVNDVGLNGDVYIFTVAIIAIVWIILLRRYLLKDTNMINPFFAKLVVLKFEKQNMEKKKN
jgi:hypothetical protein